MSGGVALIYLCCLTRSKTPSNRLLIYTYRDHIQSIRGRGVSNLVFYAQSTIEPVQLYQGNRDMGERGLGA